MSGTVNRLKSEANKAEIETLNTLDEIERVKKELRSHKYNENIRHKYVY